MGKLILVRHGHTHLNRAGADERLRGWLDVPLDDEGLREAVTTAEQLAHYPVEIIYSSDLRRARQTAEIVRRHTRARVIAAKELRPWNLGVFCGQRVREVVPFLNQLNQFPDLPAPSGESFHQFYGRYSTRLNELLALAEKSSRYIVAITHVRNLLATKTILERGDRDRVPVRGGPATGTLTVIGKEDGVWRICDNSVALRVPVPVPQLAEACS
ncbi:MAG: histidine phosphatase family protein [Terriglobales bacterium]|jgi:broad specificity phosphatase PhoE